MSRARLAACCATTGRVASSLLSGAVAHVLHVQASADNLVRLGTACGDLFTDRRYATKGPRA